MSRSFGIDRRGCELAMACHLRISNEKAITVQPEVKSAIIAAHNGDNKALQFGLVNYVVLHDQFLVKSKELLNEIIINSSKSIQGIIKSINSYFETGNLGFEKEVEEFGNCFLTNDSKEAVSAFLEKRKPNFSGD